MLENINAGILYFCKDEDYEKYASAIKNVVQDYKKLKAIEQEHQKENGELRKKIKKLEKSKITLERVREIQEENKNIVNKKYIPKSKIEEKIKELEEKIKFEENKRVLVWLHKQKRVLEELLESEKNK